MSRGAPLRRVLVIGLDSADARLIEDWCAAGRLPALAALRAEGQWLEPRTSADVFHVSAWPTLYTGAGPGAHGMYHAYQIRAGEQEVHRTDAAEIGLPPFWKLLDAAGVRCVVLDAFMNARLEGFAGVQILEYGTWTWFSEPGATPNGLWRELVRRFGAYPAPEHTKVHSVPEPVRFRDQLVAGARKKGEVSRWLMEREDWQLFFVTFGEPHAGGHYLWHVRDRDYPTYPGPLAGLGDDALLDVYAAVDREIGALVEAAGDGVDVLVVSGDGMGPNFAGCQHVPEALHRLGAYYGADVGGAAVGRPAPGSGDGAPRTSRSLASRLRALVPPGVRLAVNRCLPASVQHRLSMRWANADIDWERTRAFCIPNANEGYVRLNLRGREPRGNVEPGGEAAELTAELRERLGELVVPAGARAVEHVHDVDALCPGPRRPDLPDLSVTWNPAAKVLGELESAACGRIVGAPGHATAPYYTGNHRPNAFVLARGPSIAGGAPAAGHVADLAPTLLAMFDVPVPAHMDGRPWEHFLGVGAGR